MSAAPLSRQINYLIDRPSFQSELRLSSLLSEVGQDPSTSSSEWHKVALRINSLLHSNQDVAKGFQLALEMVREVPWESVVPYASHWISSALMHYSLAINDASLLLNRLLGEEAKEKAEYWRNLASVNVPKYALVLLEAVGQGETMESSALASVLQSLHEQVRLHPTVYRSHAAQLQKVCSRLLLIRPDVMSQVSKLMAALHLTGKGHDNQVQLWTTTLDLLLEDVKSAWAACSSTFEGTSNEERKMGLMAELPSDEMDALSEAHIRLKLLLGKPPSAGIIGIFLSEPTMQAVPFPVDRLVSILLSILSLSPISPPRQQPPPEANLHAAQTALLSSTHISALTLLASIPLPLYYSKKDQIVSKVLRIVEKSSPAVRCVAFKVLLMTNLALNPESQILIRSTRTCLAQIARLLKATNVGPSSSTDSKDKRQNGGEKGNKRRKLYESDQVQFTQKKGFMDLEDDEYEGCVAAIAYLPLLYEALASNLSAEHCDLAHTSALVLLGVTEISLQQVDYLTATCLKALAALVRLSRGAILALMTTRAASLASQALHSPHYETKLAAKELSQSLEFTFHPRLPPKLSLRLHVEDDKGHADEEEVVLGKVELDESRGLKEIQAMEDVLDIQSGKENHVYQQQQQDHQEEERSRQVSSTISPILESPQRRKAATPLQLSPDPVKPMRRPSTPRIGSPSSSVNILSNPTTTATLSRKSISPERSASSQLFRGQSSNHIAAAAASTASSPIVAATAAAPLSTSVSSSLAQKETLMEVEDSDDDAIPELDLRSSDEESDDNET